MLFTTGNPNNFCREMRTRAVDDQTAAIVLNLYRISGGKGEPFGQYEKFIINFSDQKLLLW